MAQSLVSNDIIIFSIHAELIRIIDKSSWSYKIFQIEFQWFETLVNEFYHFDLPYIKDCIYSKKKKKKTASLSSSPGK